MGWPRALQELSSSACGVAAIHSECVTDHEACARTAKPKHSGGDLLRPTKSTNRLVSHDVFHGVRFLGQHVRNHRRFDRPRANRVNANTPGGIFERSTLRQTDHSVFGRMIRCSARYTDQAADRGAVYDRAASLLAHLAQLVDHAVSKRPWIAPTYRVPNISAR